MEKDADWLDHLVFCEVERIWNQVISEERPNDPAPSTLYVLHCANADWNRLVCYPPVVRAWLYDRTGQRTRISPDQTVGGSSLTRILGNQEHRRGRTFYDIGLLKFHIATDRQLLIIHYTVGPRYGAGWVARISGEGELAKLEKDPAFGIWAA